MKAKLLLLGLAALPLVGGCNSATSAPESTNAAPEATVELAAPASPTTTNLPPEAVVPEGTVVNTELTVPATVKLSPPATEIAKMARAGVAASVMMSYVQNSVNTYQLAADEIVYLNDLGVHPDVVSAMILHDQQIREASVNGAVAASPATPGPGASVWSAGAVAETSNVWQETAAAPAAEAEVQTTVPPPPAEERPAEVTVNYFYDSLSPYGTWIDIPGYGYSWRPTVAVTYPGWRPYVNSGRWLWTDCGWYWYSDYSWGWAPFHYGRWFSHPSWGWCWVPGTVWGPSWVSWRYTDGYCGWAPLPPAAYYSPRFGFSYYGRSCGVGFSFGLTWDYFTFVSYNNFCGRYYDRHRIGRHESAQIYNNSTVINNVIVGDNNTIINQGISPDRITAATRNEVPRANVRTLANPAQTIGGRHESLATDGSTLAVVRHEVPGHRPPARAGSQSTRAAASDEISSAADAPAPMTSIRSEGGRPSRGVGPARNPLNAATASETSGTRNTVAPTASTPAAPATVAEADSTTRATQTPRGGGALIIREGRTTSTPATDRAAAPVAQAPAASATPWLNNSAPSAAPTTRSSSPTWQTPAPDTSASSQTTTRPGRSGNSTVIRIGSDPRSSTSRYQSSQPAANSGTRSSVAPAQPTVRSSSSPWSAPSRVGSSATPPTRSWNNSAAPAVRSTPANSAPAVSQPAPAPAPTIRSQPQPAPAQTIQRSAPTRPYSPPAVSPPARSSSTPWMQNTRSRIESTSRPQPAPAPAAPSPRSAPASSGNSGSGSPPSRPGR